METENNANVAIASAIPVHETDLEPVAKKQKKQSSSVPGLSTGDVRKCMNQIRKAHKSGCGVRPEHILFNGWTAGHFALQYIIGHNDRRQKVGGVSVPECPAEGCAPVELQV